MADKTKIEWTDATWNPVYGCSKVSQGCKNCYAESFMERFRGTPGHVFEHGFDVRLAPNKLDQPLRWQKPRRIFVNSMSDLFHEEVPFPYIAAVFGVMGAAKKHTFQVLTKRPARMLEFFKWVEENAVEAPSDSRAWSISSSRDSVQAKWVGEEAHRYVESGMPDQVLKPWPLPNVWLGVSVEDQAAADERIPLLASAPAAVRFLSMEPLLGPVDLRGRLGQCNCVVEAMEGAGMHSASCDATKPLPIDWVIVGGESGRKARPMSPEWATSIRDQCQAAGVAFHFKQWGEWAPDDGGWRLPDERRNKDLRMVRVGKKTAGRTLDGRTWDEMPRKGVSLPVANNTVDGSGCDL